MVSVLLEYNTTTTTIYCQRCIIIIIALNTLDACVCSSHRLLDVAGAEGVERLSQCRRGVIAAGEEHAVEQVDHSEDITL